MKKTILRPLALLLAALCLVPFAACAVKQDSPKLEHNILHFYSVKDSMTTFFLDGKKLSDQIGGGITLVGTVDGQDGFVTAASALYRIDGDGLLKVYPAAVTNAVLSLDGRFILFATSTQVFLYDCGAKKYDQLPDIEAKSIIGLVLSPDGSAAGVAVTTAEDRIVSYVYSDGKTALYGEDRCIAAIANGGKLSYSVGAANGELTGELYCRRDGKDSLIANGASPYFEVNRDLTEITFDIAEKTHISQNGGEAKKLTDASVFSMAGAQYSAQGGSAVITLLKNCGTLLDSVFYTNTKAQDEDGNTLAQYNVYYIDRSLNAAPLAIGTSQFTVSEDGKNILCVVDDGLYRVSAYTPTKPQQIASNIYSFCCTADLGTIYSIDMNGNLRRIRNGSSSAILVSGVQLAKMMKNGTVVCYAPTESNGTLIWLKDDKANAIGTNVAYFEVYENAAAYLADYDEATNSYDLYIGTDGVNYELAVEDVRIGA
ncbi:MAG: hypothetical protein J5544_06635 [Clostridia bacterium]|nr:hypothetical protein [Clostridia bacterium]